MAAVIPGDGLTTGLFLPNIPAPERAEAEYTDHVIADNSPHDGYTPIPGVQPLGDNNPDGDIPGIPVM